MTITGNNLLGTSSVTLDQVPAQFTVQSNTSLVVIVPLRSRTMKAASFNVTTPGGTATSGGIRVI